MGRALKIILVGAAVAGTVVLLPPSVTERTKNSERVPTTNAPGVKTPPTWSAEIPDSEFLPAPKETGVWMNYDPRKGNGEVVEGAPGGAEDIETIEAALTWAVTPGAILSLTPSATPPASGAVTPAIEEPALQALVEAGALTGGSDRVFGGGRSSGPDTAPDVIFIPTVVPTPTATPTSTGFEPVSGQPRGYAMLYLMQPQARATVESQIEIMLTSNVQELYLGVLTDGTFSVDIPYLNSVLVRLAQAGRSVTLVLYLSNGATMRSFDSTPINAGFSKIEPGEFRGLIKFDPEIRSEFISLCQRVKPIYALNKSLHPLNRNIAVVMLEDNLDADSYRAMRDLAELALGAEMEFVRNPCPGCYEGNDADPQGDGLELHTAPDVQFLGPRDGFTLDGTSFHFDEEPPSPALNLAEVRNLATVAVQRRLRYFGLWRTERQGLGQGPIDPALRQYEVPSPAHQEIEAELLRAGLEPSVD